jgi:hypothetical protein
MVKPKMGAKPTKGQGKRAGPQDNSFTNLWLTRCTMSKTVACTPAVGQIDPSLLIAMRGNRWPDRGLVQAVAIYMVIAYVPMLWHVFAEATGHLGSDFQAFWGAGWLIMARQSWFRV